MKSKLFRKKKQRMAERKVAKELRKIPVRELSLGLLLWLSVSYLFYGSGVVKHIDIAEGQRVPTTIVATVDFDCENLTETEFNRRKAANGVSPVFTTDPAPLNRAIGGIDKLFTQLQQYQTVDSNQQATIRISLTGLLDGLGTAVTTDDFIGMFTEGQITNAHNAIRGNLQTVLSAGILSEEYRRTLFRDASTKSVTIKNTQTGASRTLPQREIPSVRDVIKKISGSLNPVLADPQHSQDKMTVLLSAWITPNLTYDAVATDLLRSEASQSVEPVIQQYLAGTTLAQAGEPATPQTLLLLQAHEQKQSDDEETFDRFMNVVGNSIQLLAGLIIAIVILRIVAPHLLLEPDKLFLLCLLSLLTLAAARLLLYLSIQYQVLSPSLLTYLVPHALAVLLAGILIGAAPALCLGLWTSYATATLFSQSFNVFALGLLITITATSTVRNVHQRSSLFKAGLWVGAVMVLFVLISAILNQPTLHVLLTQLGAAVVNGMVSAVLVMLLIPLFESLFKITTDITLLELSDMGNPLLQKLAIQAPGTYHHSLMVASLSQTAAEKIGANPLLVRVCAYYHDIGKLAKPEFFAENIQHQENPHDDLSPHMSALVIVSHVKEGLTLAKRNKLPKPILDAIEQHHGNGLISFFYQKAKTQQQKESAPAGTSSGTESVNDSDFRYGGNPAVSAEMAILSLADATEAASRSIEKPTPTRIANLVDDIFKMKIRDGQMDNCNLTMAQINEIKRSFIFSLTNMLHGRIAYPKEDESYSNQQTKQTSGSKRNGTETNALAG
ncbi:MAG: HDIG domain-containing protein [Kiritimatiellales bacterium]|nr:HDIG domain-containing protein [Kiritimatiellales bacterium]